MQLDPRASHAYRCGTTYVLLTISKITMVYKPPSDLQSLPFLPAPSRAHADLTYSQISLESLHPTTNWTMGGPSNRNPAPVGIPDRAQTLEGAWRVPVPPSRSGSHWKSTPRKPILPPQIFSKNECIIYKTQAVMHGQLQVHHPTTAQPGSLSIGPYQDPDPVIYETINPPPPPAGHCHGSVSVIYETRSTSDRHKGVPPEPWNLLLDTRPIPQQYMDPPQSRTTNTKPGQRTPEVDSDDYFSNLASSLNRNHRDFKLSYSEKYGRMPGIREWAAWYRAVEREKQHERSKDITDESWVQNNTYQKHQWIWT